MSDNSYNLARNLFPEISTKVSGKRTSTYKIERVLTSSGSAAESVEKKNKAKDFNTKLIIQYE